MSLYRERMDELSLDQSFKNSLLDKMREKAQSVDFEKDHMRVDSVQQDAQISVQQKDRKRRLLRALIPLASAVVLCVIITPVAVNNFNSDNDYDCYNVGENLSDDNSIGAAGDSAVESYHVELSQPICDMYGNILKFNDISVKNSVYEVEPEEGNIFVIFSVYYSETCGKTIDFKQFATSYYEVNGYVGELIFREDIFDKYFQKSADDLASSINGQLVFEAKDDIIEYLQAGKEGNVYLGWQDLYFKDEAGNSYMQLEIPVIYTLMNDVREESD